MVIIGAGVAGLAAAQHLYKHGIKVGYQVAIRALHPILHNVNVLGEW